MGSDGDDLDLHFSRVVDSLSERFAGVHDRDTVHRVVQENRRRLEIDARVTSYLPVLVTRHATAQLTVRNRPEG